MIPNLNLPHIISCQKSDEKSRNSFRLKKYSFSPDTQLNKKNYFDTSNNLIKSNFSTTTSLVKLAIPSNRTNPCSTIISHTK